jgi:hydroxypyruvate isomerase
MPQLAANVSTLFTELPFLDRYDAAAAAGFRGVECQFPYAVPAQAIRERLDRHGLTQVLFNAPPGNMAAGDRGIAGLPGREAEFRASLEQALHYARVTACGRIHVMAGLRPVDVDASTCREQFIGNLAYAADLCAGEGIQLLIEPINTRVDVPGYLIDTTAAAVDCIRRAARPNIRLQYDVYHMQIMEGDLARSIQRLLPVIGHIQIADNPGRHEPGTGEINFAWLLAHLDEIGYRGWVGCEYSPATSTLAGLAWARPWLDNVGGTRP